MSIPGFALVVTAAGSSLRFSSAFDEGETVKKEFLEIGKIINTHGVSGEMKIEPWCDSPDVLKKIKKFLLLVLEKENARTKLLKD